ncbi:hypothetical protein NSA47_00515 [Irregularibacter muris]|uniref:ABC transporter permease n=1 Tax=Irregularibacter muris TaxID=1796619 RepID=A0AAE3HDP8_9FIRM|nr:ABC transporter permease [Irregularibacter muris]MCR1897472.1 hypothetical protein [Irregularibacter muris]
MDLFISEIKRQFTTKKCISYIGIAVTLAVLWSWFIVGGKTIGFLGNATYPGLRGIEAIEASAKDKNVYAGEMTEDIFERSGRVFLDSIQDEYEIVISDELLQMAVYADKLVMQDYYLRTILGRDLVSYGELQEDFGQHFYEGENLYYENLIPLNTKNQSEEKLASKMWSDVEKPYTYYGGFEVWSEGIEHIQLFGFVLLMMVTFFASGIIAKDKESGLDEIISTTRGGRKSLLAAKILIPILMGTFIYAVGMGLYIFILKYMLPTNALETSIQLSMTSVLPYTLGQMMRSMLAFGLIGTITISAFTTFISSRSNKASVAMMITVLILIGGFILAIQMDLNNPILEWIHLSLPGSLMFSYSKFYSIPILSVLGKAVLAFDLNVWISIILIFICLGLTSWKYVRR